VWFGPPDAVTSAVAAAAPESTPGRVMVTLDLDSDVLERLKAQPTDWQRELNNLARFFMENSDAPIPPPQAYDLKADFIPF